MTEVSGTRVALVTGASGFVASRLCRRLVSDGWNVHVVVRPESVLEQLAPVADRVTVHRHAGTTEELVEIVAGVRPLVVFHLASLFLSQHSTRDVAPLVQSNVLFGVQLLEACTAASVRCFVNTGTSWQHYEGHDYSPVGLYAATKQAFEDLLLYYVEATGLRAVTLVLSDTYGAGDRRRKLFWLLRQAAASGERIGFSPGEQMVDLVHIDDVCAAYVRAADEVVAGNAAGHRRYAVTSGAPLRLRDLVGRVERYLGRSLPIDWGSRPYRPREVMVPWQGPAVPGWSPRVSLEDGIAGVMEGSK